MKHSKITAIVLTLCMLVTLMVVAPTAASATTDANLVKDGSFEAWGATGECDESVWSYDMPGTGEHTYFGPVASEKYDGNYSIKMQAVKDKDGKTITNRRGIAYSIGAYPLNTTVKVSLKVKVPSLVATSATTRLRMLVRFVNGDKTFTNNNKTGEAFPFQYVTEATDGWVQLASETKIDSCGANINMVLWLESQGLGEFEAYVDDVRVEAYADSYVNLDFETGDLTGWTKSYNAVNPTVKKDETGNHYVEFDMGEDNGTQTQEGVKRQFKGLKPGAKYLLTFDVCSSGPYFWLDGAGGKLTDADPGVGNMFASVSTGGVWQGHAYSWTQPEGKTTMWVRFILWKADGFVQGTDYVRLDNVALTEVDPTNLITNGSFEYGNKGTGYQGSNYSFTGYQGGAFDAYNPMSAANFALMTQVEGGIDGRYALQISRPEGSTGWTGVRKQSAAQYGIYTPELNKTYVYTAYVKNISLVDVSGKAFALMANGPDMGETSYSVADLPVGEWKRLDIIKTHTSAPVFDLRVYGTGTVLIDKVSCRELTSPVVTYTKANGAVSDALVDGGKAVITVPAAATDQGNVYALALYNRNGENKTLLNVQARTIKTTDVTKGYATFTLTAETLGADFANVNYAKLIMLKGGSYDAIQEYDLLLKAAQ